MSVGNMDDDAETSPLSSKTISAKLLVFLGSK